MIQFNKFVTAVHDSILEANTSLMHQNIDILNKYFEESVKEEEDPETGEITPKTTLEPKSVILEYPTLDANGVVKYLEVHVPLITLVPMKMSKIEEAVLNANFEMGIVDGEIEIDFGTNKTHAEGEPYKNTRRCELELRLTPQETSEGLKLLIEGYEAILKRQLR